MKLLTDNVILSMIQAGNRAGLKYLHDKYKVTLLSAIHRMIPFINQEVAEELILHALIRTWVDRYDLPANGNFFSWLVSNIRREIEDAGAGDISKFTKPVR